MITDELTWGEKLKKRKSEWRRAIKNETKEIEKILHPVPIINGYEIVHEHLRNGYIRFLALDKTVDKPLNNRSFIVKRIDILTRDNFYGVYQKEWEYLTN